MEPGRKYFIINIDEPYAEEIFKILKKGQIKKGEWPEGNISFEEWIELTWPDRRPVNIDPLKEIEIRPNIPIKKRGIVKMIGRV